MFSQSFLVSLYKSFTFCFPPSQNFLIFLLMNSPDLFTSYLPQTNLFVIFIQFFLVGLFKGFAFRFPATQSFFMFPYFFCSFSLIFFFSLLVCP